jgi:FHA domain
MSDAHLHSIHLGEHPRREMFRQARLQLEGACGVQTLDGQGLPPAEVNVEAITRTIPPMVSGGPTCFFVRDGTDLHPLTVGINSIGRLPDNGVVIRDEHVSRRHCAIVVHSSGQCEVHDIASKNGTYLNGKKIAGPTRLKPGDQLLLCTKKLYFVLEAEQQAVAS